MEAVIDRAGRIVLPKAIRDALGLLPGTKVDISPYGVGAQIVPAGRTARLVEEDGVLVSAGDTPVGDDVVSPLSTSAASDGRGRLSRLGVAGSAVYDAVVAKPSRYESHCLGSPPQQRAALRIFGLFALSAQREKTEDLGSLPRKPAKRALAECAA